MLNIWTPSLWNGQLSSTDHQLKTRDQRPALSAEESHKALCLPSMRKIWKRKSQTIKLILADANLMNIRRKRKKEGTVIPLREKEGEGKMMF